MFYVEASIGIIASDIRCAFSRSVWKGLNSSLTAPHARPDQHELCLWIWCLIISYFEDPGGGCVPDWSFSYPLHPGCSEQTADKGKRSNVTHTYRYLLLT